jgi:hypothetical protein
LTLFNPKGVGKRMVGGQAKGQKQSRVQEVQCCRQAQSPENRQGSKPGGLAKENRKGRSTGKTFWLTWNNTRQTGTGRQKIDLSSQGIMGQMGDTWRGWRQAQGQVKQIRV